MLKRILFSVSFFLFVVFFGSAYQAKAQVCGGSVTCCDQPLVTECKQSCNPYKDLLGNCLCGTQNVCKTTTHPGACGWYFTACTFSVGTCNWVSGSCGVSYPPTCGNDVIDAGETCNSCPADAGACSGDTCTGGSNPECTVPMSSNCGTIGKVGGSGSCGNGNRCCVDPGGSPPACQGTATVCFWDSDCAVCGANQCCNNNNDPATNGAGNCRSATSVYTLKCGPTSNWCGQNYQCDGTKTCPSSQANLAPPAVTGMSPVDNATVAPALTCGAVCTSNIDCGSHWVEGTLSNGPGPAATYRYMYFDAARPTQDIWMQEDSTLVGTSKGFTSLSANGYSGGTSIQSRGVESAFWFPTTSTSVDILSRKTTTSSYMNIFVDGKASGISPVNVNGVAQNQYPITVPIGAQTNFACSSGACRLKTNPSSATCVDDLTKHTVRIVNGSGPASPNMAFDAIIEDGVKTEQTSPRFYYSNDGATSGIWIRSNSANHSGGSADYRANLHAYVEFTTSASSLTYLGIRASSYGAGEVFIDGIHTQTLDFNKTGSAVYQAPFTINLPGRSALTGTEKSVYLSWNPGPYTRFNLELYPTGTSCADPRAFCGRVVRPDYRFVPAVGVGSYKWRVNAINDLCVPYSKTPVDGTWSPLYTLNLNINSTVTGTVETDPTGSAVIVGGLCTASGTSTYAGGGTITVTGNSQNSSTALSGTGTYTTATLPGGSGYTVTLGNLPAGYAVTCPAGGAYNPVTLPASPLPFYVSAIEGPWYQTRGGDIGALLPGVGTSIKSEIPQTSCVPPTCNPYFSLPGVWGNNATAGSLVVGSSSTVDLKDTTTGTQDDNVGQPSRLVKLPNIFVTKENYDYFYRLYSLGFNPDDKDFTTAPQQSTNAKEPTRVAYNPSGAYYRNGNLTIDTDWDVKTNKSYVIFVKGDLTIKKTIHVDSTSFVGFIVGGNITIDPSVGTGTFSATSNGQIQGFYLAQGTINIPTIGASGTEKKLVAEGTFVSYGGFSIKRDFRNGGNGIQNNSYPAVYFVYRPDLVKNVPDRMKSPITVWKEVTP